jgi:hypothetical protein
MRNLAVLCIHLFATWVLVVLDQCTRRIIGFGFQAGKVDGVALCGMFNRAIRGQRGLPKYVSSDNDPLYLFHQWQANMRVLEVAQIKSIPDVPLSHPFVEGLIGTIRREYLDHLLFWTTADLENKLLDFRTYFNNHRTHTSREGRTPDPHAARAIANLRSFRWQPHCRALSDTGGGLICQRLAFAAIFGQPRQNFQEIIRFAASIVSLPPVASRK